MAICDRCGGEIEFRYMNGAPRPIHLSGGCAGSSGQSAARSNFGLHRSYLDPNATCPVCGAAVFFYRSPHNGRVFFDDVGWPWPKHRCTDKYHGSDSDVLSSVRSSFKFHLRGTDGVVWDVYIVESVVNTPDDDGITLRLKSLHRRGDLRIQVKTSDMTMQGVTRVDVRASPALVVKRAEDIHTEASFLCARLQAVVVLNALKIFGTDKIPLRGG